MNAPRDQQNPPHGSGETRARIGTRAVHPPVPAPQGGRPVVPLLDLSTTYAFDDADEFARASQEKVGGGYVYTRWANPTIDAFEAAVADLEGAEEAEAFSTGMAAISCVFLALCSAGDRVVAARQLYGNTFSLLTDRLPRFGIDADIFDVDDFASIEAALPGARILFCETIGNPVVQMADLDRLGELAAAAGATFVVDNTFASPVLCRPLEHGAHVVVHSATKFLGGHLDLMGGVVCTDTSTLNKIRKVARDLGPTLSPFSAWLALRGMQTLVLRVERTSATAATVARALAERDDVENVHYPTLDAESQRLADRLLGGAGGGTLGFDLRGGRERARRFQDSLRVIQAAASLGGTRSLIVHAASVTHTQLDDDKLRAAGISPGFCRLAIGLEDPADLIEDIDQALTASSR